MTERLCLVGERLWVTGGYDPDPEWLAGGEGYAGTLVELSDEWAVVELDDELVLTGQWQDFSSGSAQPVGISNTARGRWLALAQGWEGWSWTERTGRLHVGLCSQQPDLAAILHDGGIGAWAESHAGMRHLTETP